jgi:hypothetical protein
MGLESERFMLLWPRWSKTDATFLILLVVVVVGFHWEMVILGHLSLDEDTLLFFYPLRAISQDPFVGLWDPYLFCGIPRDGNPQSQLLYPPNVVLLFLSAPSAYVVLLVGHMVVGVLGVYLLVRFFRCTSGPAFVAALAFAGGSFWRCKAMNLGNMEGNAWIPFLLLAFTYGVERGSLRWGILAGAFASLIVGAGAPHPVLYAALLCTLLCVSLISAVWKRLGRSVLFCAVAAVVAAGLSAWSWLPAADYLPRSNRGPLSLDEAYNGSLQLRELPGILLCGLTQRFIARLDPWEGTLFFGAAGLVLAGLGVWSRRDRRAVWALALATVVGLVFALGPNTPIYPFVRRIVPGMDSLNLPNRSLLLGAWSIPLLIGLGAQHLLNAGTRSKRYLLAAVISGLALVGLWYHMARAYPRHWETVINPSLTGTFDRLFVPDLEWSMWAALLWGVSTCLVLACRRHVRLGYGPHLGALAALILSQEIYVAPRFFFEFTSPDFFRPPPLVRWVQDHHERQGGRVLGYSKAIPVAGDIRCSWIVPHLSPRLPEIFRLPEIQGYEPVYPRTYGELVRAWAGQSRASDSVRHVQLSDLPPRLIDFLGVRTIIGDTSARLCTFPQALIGPGQDRIFDFSETVHGSRLFLRHICDGMASLPPGTVIAKVTIQDASGTSQQFPVRFLEDVAEFLPGAPAEVGRARVFRWWPLPGSDGYRTAMNYWSRWLIDPPFPIKKVSLRNEAPVGRWVVLEMVLTDAERDTYPRLFSDGVTEARDNPSAFPPAWIAASHEVIVSATDRIGALTDERTDLRTTVILAQCGMRNAECGMRSAECGMGSAECGMGNAHSASRPTVLTERLSSDEIICRIPNEATGFLVITEGYSPWWRATADGRPLPVYVADHAFMAVPLIQQAGMVRLVYRPVPFYIGCGISGLTLVICVCVLAATRRGSRAGPGVQLLGQQEAGG